ncbi:HAMP domain-containing sensor histidine kinase [Planococcus sp. CPCC 101016]|uniref:sensor histidine kinase n=1 Tax=Planococcus sp. CPCC 101016 TaxID=2599617 RepID=UPI00164737CB|nr:sensor histidine kinase [Planococcus sp. CPCC 101016]
MHKESTGALLKSFLLSVRPQLIVFLGIVVIFGTVYVLNRLPLTLFFYSLQISAFLLLIYLLIHYFYYAKRYKLINNLQLVNASNLEEVQQTADPADQLYIEKMKALLEQLRESENFHAERQTDQLDYFTLWLHQIKTPISAISLLTQSSQAKEAKQVSQELVRLEDYTHMALNYIKLEEPGAELDLSMVDVDELIKKVIKKYSILFIYKGIKLDYQPLDMQVLSDGKWLQNLLEQILSNSLKYTPAGTISIYQDSENPETMVIEDTGIGIRSEDLPKIFNKGYSGMNGRLHEKSTGLGLFLSKKICQRLGHQLAIDSQPGEGTRVAINLVREELNVFD